MTRHGVNFDFVFNIREWMGCEGIYYYYAILSIIVDYYQALFVFVSAQSFMMRICMLCSEYFFNHTLNYT